MQRIQFNAELTLAASCLNLIAVHTSHITQERQNVTLRRVRVTNAAVEKQKVLHILSVSVAFSMQSACAVLYYNLWPIWLYNIFTRYLINGTIFGKLLLNIKSTF
jgi:hypothetical protein